MPRAANVATKHKNGAAATAAAGTLAKAAAKTPRPKVNGGQDAELRELLHALQAVRVGDFSVRLPGDQIGLDRQDRRHLQRNRRRQCSAWLSSSSGSGRWSATKARPASASASASPTAPGARWRASVNSLIDDLLWPTTEVTRAIAAVAQGDLLQTVPLDVDGRPLEGRVPALGQHRQHHDRAAQRLHLGSDPRGARGRHRRQARRPGAGAAA